MQFYIASVHRHVPKAAMLMASDLLISSLIQHSWHDVIFRRATGTSFISWMRTLCKRHANSLGWPADDAVKPRSAKNKRLQKPNWKRKTWGPGARVLWLALLQTLSLSNAADLSMDVQQKCLSSTIHVKVPGEV